MRPLFLSAIGLIWLGGFFSICDFMTNLQESETANDTLTYTNELLGYSIDYPANWFVGGTERTLLLESFESGSDSDSEGIPFDQTQIDIFQVQGITDFSQVAQEAASESSVQSVDYFSLNNGANAVEITGFNSDSEFGSFVTYYAEVGSTLIGFIVYGDPTPARQIVATLRPAD